MAGKYDSLLEDEFKAPTKNTKKVVGNGGFDADAAAAQALADFDSEHGTSIGHEPGVSGGPATPNPLTAAGKALATGIVQGAFPGDMGERMAKSAGVDDSLLYTGGRVYGALAGAPEKFIANKAFQIAGKIPGGYKMVRGAMEAVPGAAGMASRLAQRTLGGGIMGGTEQGAKELIAQVMGERKDENGNNNYAQSAGNVAGATAEGMLGGATFGSLADYLLGKARTNKLGEWLAEIPFRSNALGKAKLNSNPLSESPRQTPVQAMQELGLTGSGPQIKQGAVDVVDKTGPAIGAAKQRAFDLADQNGVKIPPQDVLGGLVSAYQNLKKIPGQQLGEAERGALGSFIQDLAGRLGAKNLQQGISPRDLDSLVELNKKFLADIGERGNLFRQELDPSGKLSAEIRAIRRFVQDAESAVDNSVVGQLGPSDGRAYLANNRRYGQGRDALRLVNSADAERSGMQVGRMSIGQGGLKSVGNMASSVIPTSAATRLGDLVTRASRVEPVDPYNQGSRLWNLIGLSRNPGIQSTRDVQRLISAGVQNGTLSPQAALDLIGEVLQEGARK